MQTASFDT